MLYKPQIHEEASAFPRSNNLQFASSKFSSELPLVPSQIFDIETPDLIMIDFPNAESFRKEYVGTYEETKNFLRARIERTYHLDRKEAYGIAHEIMKNIGAPKSGGSKLHPFSCDDFSVTQLECLQLDCAPTLILYDASWTHLTIWNEAVYLKAGRIDVDQCLFRYNLQYFRCIRPCFYDLYYSVDGKKWDRIERSLYGTPDVTSFRMESLAEKKQYIRKRKRAQKDKSQTRIKTNFYLPMTVYSDFESGMDSMRDPNSIDFTSAMEEIFGPQSVSQE